MGEYIVYNWSTKCHKPLLGQSHEFQLYMLASTCQSPTLENIKYKKQQPLVYLRATFMLFDVQERVKDPPTLPQMPSFKPHTCFLFEHFHRLYIQTYIFIPTKLNCAILTFHTYNCVHSYGFYTCFGEFPLICVYTQQMIPNSLYT